MAPGVSSQCLMTSSKCKQIRMNTIYGSKSFLSKESDTKILQSIYFAYEVGTISSYSNSNYMHKHTLIMSTSTKIKIPNTFTTFFVQNYKSFRVFNPIENLWSIRKIPVTKIRLHHHDQAIEASIQVWHRGLKSQRKNVWLQLRPFPNFRLQLLNIKLLKIGSQNFVVTSTQLKSQYTARILCFNKSFIRNCTVSTGIPNLECDGKSINWTPDVGVGQKNPTPTPMVVRILTPPRNLQLLATLQPWTDITTVNQVKLSKIVRIHDKASTEILRVLLLLRGIMRGARRVQFPACRIIMGLPNHCRGWCRKVPTMWQIQYFLQQHMCFRKNSGSNMGVPNLFFALATI